MTIPFLSGLALGLALILPIGAQNVFVFNQGIHVGLPRALWAVVGAGLCDTLLIVMGAAGVSAILYAVPGLQPTLLAGGVLFLSYLGIKALRAEPEALIGPSTTPRARDMVARTAAVSLLNPHAVLDTVGVLGTAISAQAAATRTPFAMGVLSASWTWFLFLAVGATVLRGVMDPARRVWFDRASGVLLLVFAAVFAKQLIAMLW